MELKDVITPEIVAKAQKVLEESLTAERRVRAGNGQYEDVPDNKVRITAAELIIAYHLGRPTSKNLNLNVNKDRTPGQRLPADVVRRMIDNGVDVQTLLAESIQLSEQTKTAQTDEVIDI